MVQKIISYKCSICGRIFEKLKGAAKCEAQRIPEQKFKVGQKVRATIQLPNMEGLDTGKIDDTSVSNEAGKHTRKYAVKFDHDIGFRSMYEPWLETARSKGVER